MTMNTATAITIGYIWVVGSALVAMAIPASLTALIVHLANLELPRMGVAVIGFFVAQAIAAATCGLIAHAVMTPLWRAWAYRRVPDVSLLKRRAQEAGITYPSSHILGRSEWTSAKTREKLERLEWSGGTGEQERSTLLGTLLRSIQYGGVFGLIALLTASLILKVSDTKAVLYSVFGIGAFVWFLTAFVIYGQARRMGTSANEALKSLIPASIRRQD